MFNNGVDQGYRDNPRWWFEGPDAFRIADLDKDYPAEYFEVAGVPKDVIENYVHHVTTYYRRLTGRGTKPAPYRGIIEFGAGGGWFTKEFKKHGINIDAIEGSDAGFRKMELEGLDDCIQKMDFRQVMPDLEHKYDLALASEILEHVEPNFHAVTVGNLCRTANMVWFSSEDPEIVHNRQHLHHSGEFPLRYWTGLFKFFGFERYMLPDYVYEYTAGRSRAIFYRKDVHQDHITING